MDSDSELEEDAPFIPASLHKRSPIHNYFTYKKETNKSVCKNKKCRVEINGKNSTNLVNHLKIPIHFKSEYEKYLEELSDYKEASASKKQKTSTLTRKETPQQTLHQVFSKKIPYSRNCKKQIFLRKKLAFFVATTLFATSLCENQDFDSYVSVLDDRHTLPTRQRLTQDIMTLASKGKMLIKQEIKSALSKPIATSEIWSKKGLSSSYLGVTLHFVSSTHKLQKVVLDLIYFPPPHTGTEVAKLTTSVFKKWDIQVPIIITDNGSNMIKAFKEVRANHMDEVIENVVASNTEKETSDDANLFSDIEDDIAVQVSPSETYFHQEEDRQTLFLTDPDLNIETEESTIELENEEVEYEIFEAQIKEALIQIQSCVRRPNESEEEFKLRRLSCLSHRLQLVMSIFDNFKFIATRNSNSKSADEIAASRRNTPAFVKVIAKGRKLASKINTSSIATPLLIKLAGKKLLSDVSTRWSSNYLVMNDMYNLRKPINDVCEELGWDSLSYTDWSLLKNIIDLLEPFASLTQLVSGDKYVTFSSVVPCLEDLKLHLEECAKVTGLNVVSEAMLDDLKRRHDFITDESHPEFDSVYLLATSLDVNYRIFLLCDQSVQNLLLRNVVKVAKQMGIEYNSIPEDQIQDRDARIEAETPPEDNTQTNLNTSSFRYLSKKLAQRLSTETPRSLSRSSSSLSTTTDVDGTDTPHLLVTIESELLDYFNLATVELEKEKGRKKGEIGTPMKDAILYWKDNAARFPYLTKLAFSLLAIPASSASAERQFSAAGWHCLGRKNRTTQDVLASKVFLTCNKDILRPMLL